MEVAMKVAGGHRCTFWWLLVSGALLESPAQRHNDHLVQSNSSCSLQRFGPHELTATAIANMAQPAILTGLIEAWPARHKWASRAAFTQRYGDTPGYIRDHDQLELRDLDMSVEQYLQGEQVESASLNLSTSASFFVNDYEDARLLDRVQHDYEAPAVLNRIGALRVISVERLHAGVTFHRHEEAWQAQVTGSKAWYVIAPSVDAVPLHNPCSFEDEGTPPMATRCEVSAGEVFFVPKNWWHATCSLDVEASYAVGGVGSTSGWSEPLLAARRGDAKNLKLHLSEKRMHPDVFKAPQGGAVFVGGETPLFMGAAFGHREVVRVLLAQDADPTLPRQDGRTAVHEAARRGDEDIIGLLLSTSADLGSIDASGSNVLHHACAERGHAQVVKYLLERGASASKQRNDGRAPLHIACRSHRNPVPILRALLQSGQAAPSAVDKEGQTPLMHCAAAGHAQGVGLLLRFGGAESARVTDKDGHDALWHALAGRGDTGVVTRLLGVGLPAASRLVQAAKLGDTSTLRLLLAAGASSTGSILEAAKSGHGASVRILAGEHGQPIDERDPESGATALHLSSFTGHLGAVQTLLALRADASASDNDGLSALHYAAASHGRVPTNRQVDIMEAIVYNGSGSLWNSTSKAGMTPLHVAAAAGATQLAHWLVHEKAVADPGAKDNQSATPADAAEQAEHTHLAALLRQWDLERQPVFDEL